MRTHKIIEILKQQESTGGPAWLSSVIQNIKESVKFYCPPEWAEWPECFDANLIRLPYPVCVFEFDENEATNFVLCSEHESSDEFLEEVNVKNVFKGTDRVKKVRFFYKCFAFIHKTQNLLTLDAVGLACEMEKDSFIIPVLIYPLESSPEHMDMSKLLIEKSFAALRDTLALLNCENIPTELVRAPAKLNKKRNEKGLGPIFSYRVLKLPRHDSPRYIHDPESESSELRRLRQHWVRGHIRRITDNRATWISAHLRGDATLGTVERGFKISAQ